ncbi:MAG: phage minor head protein [Brevinema sp.]
MKLKNLFLNLLLTSRSDLRRLLLGGLFEEYYKNIDRLINQGTKDFKQHSSKLLNNIISKLSVEDTWEDGLESILQIGNKLEWDSNEVALKLLNAQIIGRVQINDKVESLQNASFSTLEGGERLFSTFDEAREFFETRLKLPATVFHEASNEMKKYAFTISSLVKEGVIIDVSEKLLESYDKGTSFHKFKKELRSSSFSQELEELTDRQIELIYTQNMNSAYSYGRYQGLIGSVEIFPNWEYITIGDERVRSSHRALQGTIRTYNDPFWKSHYPPNGFRCRCIVEVSDEEPNGNGVPIWDKETVEKAFEDGIYPKALDLNRAIQVDMGFDHNIGEMNGWVKDRISKMNNGLMKITTRTSFFSNMSPLKNWDKSKNVITTGTDYAKLDNGLDLAKNRLKKDLGDVVFDKKGNMIGTDIDYLVDHISTSEKGKNKKRVFDNVKWNDRAKLVDKIKDIIETGEIVEDIERYDKNKKLILSRKYLKNEKDSIPVLTTIYPFNKEDQNKKVSGIYLK